MPIGSPQWMYASGEAFTLDQSLRFNDGDSAYLSKTPASAGNQKTWTWSGWVKRGNISDSDDTLFGVYDGSNQTRIYFLASDKLQLEYYAGSPSTNYYIRTNQLFRDSSAYYHIVAIFDTTQSTEANRLQLWVNGERVSSFANDEQPTLNFDGWVNDTKPHFIGGGTSDYLDGYLAEVHFIDGTALTPTSFGETGDYGEWKPIEVTGLTYGTNGFYLDFSNATTIHTITASGGIAHSTTQEKIGDTSIYFDGTNDYLSIPNHTDWTFGYSDATIEAWIRPDAVGDGKVIFCDGDAGGSAGSVLQINADKFRFHLSIDGVSNQVDLVGTTTLSTGTWYHVAMVKNGDSYKLYVDGTEEASDSWSTAYPDWSTAIQFGDHSTRTEFEGYMDEIRISKMARYTSGFTPSTSAFTEDDNTLLLIHSDTTNGSTTFTDSSGVTGGLGNDAAGSNHWTTNNLAIADQMVDSPTNNFCTWNPLDMDGTLAEGNLKGTTGTGAARSIASTIAPSSGKWYIEILTNTVYGNAFCMGLVESAFHSSITDWDDKFYSQSDSVAYHSNGNKGINGTSSSYGATYTDDDIIGMAFDLDANTTTLYKNNASQGAISKTFDGHYKVIFVSGDSGGSQIGTINCGQDSSFAGAKTAQGNQDANSIGDFYYTPPSGYLALCTSNLPAVAVTPSEHFNTEVYAGDGADGNDVTVGFQPDFTWIKSKTGSRDHILVDAIRGVTKLLVSNTTGAEETGVTDFQSFDSNGFTVGTPVTTGGTNTNTESIVSWNWKANGSGSANTVGDIDSTVSVNTDAGFSIVSYTGDGNSPATIGHGLSKAPELIHIKNRTDVDSWISFTTVIDGSLDYMYLNLTNAKANLGIATPTSTVFSVDDGNQINGSGDAHIAYCWHSVDGFSKVGTYTGNANADGTFVYTGFRPAWVMAKCSSSGSEWKMYDSKRNIYNVMDEEIRADTSGAASVHSNNYLDFLSNGFKPRYTDHANQAQTYIYLAFAETPFKYSNAR